MTTLNFLYLTSYLFGVYVENLPDITNFVWSIRWFIDIIGSVIC